MDSTTQESNGETRLAYILGVPLAENVVRQWPQMKEVVRTSQLVAAVEGNFPELTLEVGRRLQFDDGVVVEWTCDYGDGRLYRNVTIGGLQDGKAVRVTDYWGEPTTTPEWRQEKTDRLEMPAMEFGRTASTSAITRSGRHSAGKAPASGLSGTPGSGSRSCSRRPTPCAGCRGRGCRRRPSASAPGAACSRPRRWCCGW